MHVQRCCFPGCGHMGEIILNSHAKVHGFNKVKEMVTVHGKIKQAGIDPNKMRYARTATTSVSASSYNNVDSALAMTKKSRR